MDPSNGTLRLVATDSIKSDYSISSLLAVLYIIYINGNWILNNLLNNMNIHDLSQFIYITAHSYCLPILLQPYLKHAI